MIIIIIIIITLLLFFTLLFFWFFFFLFIFSNSPSRVCAWRHCLTSYYFAARSARANAVPFVRYPLNVHLSNSQTLILQFRLLGQYPICPLPFALCLCLRFLNYDGLVNCFVYKRACQSRSLHLSSPMLHQFHQCCIWLNESLENLHPSFRPSRL